MNLFDASPDMDCGCVKPEEEDQSGGWISVEERWPPDGQEVLLIYKHKIGERRTIVGYLLENEWHYCRIFQSYVINYFAVTVTHWMELPDYPKIQQSDLPKARTGE